MLKEIIWNITGQYLLCHLRKYVQNFILCAITNMASLSVYKNLDNVKEKLHSLSCTVKTMSILFTSSATMGKAF